MGSNDAYGNYVSIDAFAGYGSGVFLEEDGDARWALSNTEPNQHFVITDKHSGSLITGDDVNRMTIYPYAAEGAAPMQVRSPSSTYDPVNFNSGVFQLYSTSSITSGGECTALQLVHRGESGGSQKNRYAEISLLGTGTDHRSSLTWKLRGASTISEVMRLDHDGHLTASVGRFTAQPSFSAYATVNQTTTANEFMHVSHSAEHFDVGAGFNTTTCVYTAPETGTYMLTATTRLDSVNSGGYLWTKIVTSNQDYFGDLWSEDDDNYGGQYGSPALTVITQLTAGDTAKVYVLSSNLTANTETLNDTYVMFQGHMLS